MPLAAFTIALSGTIFCLGPEPLLKTYDNQALEPLCHVVPPDAQMPVVPTEIFMELPDGLLLMVGLSPDDTEIYFLTRSDVRLYRLKDLLARKRFRSGNA